MRIYTAQYRYGGPGRVDVTLKGADGQARLVTPTWSEVMAYKQTRDDVAYRRTYVPRMMDNLPAFAAFLEGPGWPEATLVCFCRPGDFCHRVLVAQALTESFPGRFEHLGERREE